MKKAQLLTIDFVLSLAIFVSIMLTLVGIWSTVGTQVRDVESRRELQMISLAVSDMLVRSPGSPNNWNSTNVSSIGLAKIERILDLAKIREFLKMDYYDVKDKVRLGGLGTGLYESKTFDFQVYFADMNGNNLTDGLARSPVAYFAWRNVQGINVFKKLNSSNHVWDFYWSNSLLPSSLNPSTSRFIYQPDALSSNPKLETLNLMIANQSSYRTIIIENPFIIGGGWNNFEINISGLQEFVSRGGILVVISQDPPSGNIIDENFSVHGNFNGAAGGWGDGIVVDPWYLMNETQVGAITVFSKKRWYFYSQPGDAEVKVIASVQSHPEQGMICYWNYGYGRIYYIEDLNGNVGSSSLTDVLAIIGRPLRFGLSPALPQQVITIRRTALLEGFDREPISMILRVWK